ncbi:autotransporter outer membrane beta-barrel domain-containing protein [Serratia entomophila]|uniref:autotransporter outer membrane beta-barrel domain-containing protein n=1 Tax=Serratia entomophila TaxID=42906 RepID=UPI002178F53D|nr:autotransporter serine protease [Serratia entomophila]CAI1638015.1 Extracellular serine protease precursor [Serratia entomophila]
MLVKKRLRLAHCVFLGCYGLSAGNSVAAYHEQGLIGSPQSWRSPEFNRQWGLSAISAEYAYARGYTGKGIAIGVIDNAILGHPEFNGKLTRLDNGEYHFSYDKKSGRMSFGDHGTHVAGIAAAGRDGAGMHGVAFDATLINAKLNEYGNRNGREELIQTNARVINNSWGIPPAINKDAKGNIIWLSNGSPDYVAYKEADVLNEVLRNKNDVRRQSERPVPEGGQNAMATLLRAAKQGKLIVFSAGNYNNYNIPEAQKSIPYAFPEFLNHYLIVANLSNNDMLHQSSTRCAHAASYCVSAPGADIYSSTGKLVSNTGGKVTRAAYDNGELSLNAGYGNKTGTSMAAPHVSGAAAVLMQRFPYMSADQIANVIKTTATDLGTPGIDKTFGWGKLNLRDAINGPKMFIAQDDIPQALYVPGSYAETQFVANIPGIGSMVEAGTRVARLCDQRECGFDVWSNDIGGHGGLTKIGDGTLSLSGNNSYRGDTRIARGTLAINGSVVSNVYVENGGTLQGGGTVNSFRAQPGGSVAPGNGIGTLRVLNDATFDKGSQYQVEVGQSGHSDKIEVDGRAIINGGKVNVRLENSPNLLSQNEAQSLLGNKYTLLTAAAGVVGRFDHAYPDYKFIDIALSYQGNDLGLGIYRSAEKFESLADTDNEKAVARAVEELRAPAPVAQAVDISAVELAATESEDESGYAAISTEEKLSTVNNSVYESFLGFTSASELQQAARQLSGQIHADMAAAQLNESRYVRDTVNERLRQAEGLHTSSEIKSDDNGGAWAKLLGSWGHASGNDNATGYQTSTYGVLLGADTDLNNDVRLGVMTGYSRTSLDGGYQSNAHSDNYHLGLYGSKAFGALAVRAGGAYTWHRIDTSRSVNYNLQSDTQRARYHARTEQLFVEGGYGVSGEGVNLEPFANLAYANYRNGGMSEQGGAAALRGNRQSLSATTSTLGLRADKQWGDESLAVALRGELGWQHQYGKLERNAQLMFKSADAAFNVNSVPVSRDGAALKAGVDVRVNNAVLTLGYGGQLSKNHQDNGVNAGLTWHF